MEKQTTVIEINGVKLEVDLRTAKRIDQLKIGSRVKCLVKKYSDFATYPGVIVGFEPFKGLPSIVVAYLDVNYSSADLIIKTFNSETKDFEVVADLDNNALEVNKADIVSKFERDIAKKQLELEEVQSRKAFFLQNFGTYFSDSNSAAEALG